MASGKTDLRIDQGRDFRDTFVVYDGDDLPAVLTDDGTVSGTPFTAACQLRRSVADVDTTIDATLTATVSPVGSRITLQAPAATTETLVNGPYVYDLVVIDADGLKQNVARGTAYVNLEVTR